MAVITKDIAAVRNAMTLFMGKFNELNGFVQTLYQFSKEDDRALVGHLDYLAQTFLPIIIKRLNESLPLSKKVLATVGVARVAEARQPI